MMAKDELMSRIAMSSQCCSQPIELDMAFPSEATPERVDEYQQKIATPYEVGKTGLSRRSVIRQVEHLAKHGLAHRVIGRMIAGCVPHGDLRTVQPHHFRVEPMSPLRAQGISIRCQANNFIAGKKNEFRLRSQAPDNCIDRGECPFVQCAWHARTGVSVQDKLVPFAAWKKRGDRISHGVDNLQLRGLTRNMT